MSTSETPLLSFQSLNALENALKSFKFRLENTAKRRKS